MFVSKVINNEGGNIRLIFAEEAGESCWFYLKLQPESYTEYKKKISNGNLNIKDYGDIIYSGWGKTPPDDIVKKIEELKT